jgi:3-hydroxyisobutyrate dehydrogenase-like beta-hydroxyacid dehydrogenase
MTDQGKPQVAILGTGLMGRAMAERLLAAGYPVTAYNRTRSKALPLIDLGATVVDQPHKALEASECILLMLADDTAIRETLLEHRARNLLRGRTVIQMGTIGPGQSQLLQAEVLGSGGDYLEATVLGSISEVRAGELFVMVGAEPEQYDHWRDLLANFDPEPTFVGPVGSAAALKLALNHLIGALTTAFALSLAIVLKEGIPADTFMRILRRSALYAPTFDKKLGRMLERDFRTPNFPGRLLLKDMKLIEDEVRSLGLAGFTLAGVREAVERAVEMGFGEYDYSAVYNAIHPAG